MKIPFNMELYNRLGKFIDYTAEDNGDETFKIILEYDGFYDENGTCYKPSYVVIPHISFDTEYNATVKDGKLYTDHMLQINENDEKNIFKGYGETVLYKVAFSDDDK